MRLALLLVLVVAAVPARAAATPRADLVVLWAPDRDPASILRAARAAGAALLDRSPPATPDAAIGPVVARGIEAYEALRFDEAWAALSDARTVADRDGGAGLSAATLSDLFLYRGLVQIQRGDPTAAWDELITAAVIAPTRVFDPARFAPRVLDELERARAAALARPRGVLVIAAPAGCDVVVDGVAVTTAPVEVVTGPHWIHARCAGVRWGARIEARDPSTRVAIAPAAPAPPTDDEVLIQARAAGAGTVVIVVARGELATLRLLGIDGRERARRTVALRDGEGDGAVADALAALLRPAPAARWYRSRWAWAVGAAAVAAAVVIPVTVILVGDRPAGDATIRGPGTLP